MSTLFISDLHLCAEHPAIGACFVDFLQTHAPQAEALYILGDLFETWLGDDIPPEEYRPYLEAMKALTSSGTPIYVMHGNRDFLMQHGFEQMTGARLLPDPYLLDLYGTPTLLMHGDLLCRDDVDYLKLRKQLRDPTWQQEFVAKSVEERNKIAQYLRQKSKEATSNKTLDIMDVNQEEVETTLRQYQAWQLIHGHTHRPACHHFMLDGKQATRHVLPQWEEQGGFLICDESSCRSEVLSC